MIDERPGVSGGGTYQPLFIMREMITSYPNLITLIIRDSGSGLKASGSDLCRWTILDDYGMQLVLGNLTKLKYLDIKGNLFFVTDFGVTGFSPDHDHDHQQQSDKNEIDRNQNGGSFILLQNSV